MKPIAYAILLTVLALSAATVFAFELKLKNGDTPPDYLGRNIHGDKVFIRDNPGKLVVISFWASWCSPCRKELPVLDRLQSYLGPDVIKIVAVNYQESNLTYRKLLKQLEGTSLTLTHDRRGSIGQKFGVDGLPHLIIIDETGKVVRQQRGYGEDSVDELVDFIAQQVSAP